MYIIAVHTIAMYIIAMHTIAMYIIAMHTIAIALCIKCTYLIAVHIALRPNTPGELKACTRTAQRSLCPPETISAQSSMVKDRHVRQKLYQLKVQWSKIAMSARNYVTSKFKGQTSLCPPETISAQSSKDKRRYVRQKFKGQMSLCRVTHPCRVDLGTQYKK